MTNQADVMTENLAQKVASASPEELVAMLLGAGQRFLGQASEAMRRKDHPAKWRALERVSAIIEELSSRLNMNDGGDLVVNLLRVYEWWNSELLKAEQNQEPERLDNVSHLMGELRETWERLHQTRLSAGAAPSLQMA